MPIKQPDNQHRLRHVRIEAIKQAQPITQTIQRAKQYVEDQIWLSPAELKATIRQLAETLESMLDTPQPKPVASEPVASKPVKAPKVVASPKPTHSGTVLGLKGREDYQAQLVTSAPDQMTDQHGRSFNLKDYGYDEEEAYRLDLASLRTL